MRVSGWKAERSGSPGPNAALDRTRRVHTSPPLRGWPLGGIVHRDRAAVPRSGPARGRPGRERAASAGKSPHRGRISAGWRRRRIRGRRRCVPRCGTPAAARQARDGSAGAKAGARARMPQSGPPRAPSGRAGHRAGRESASPDPVRCCSPMTMRRKQASRSRWDCPPFCARSRTCGKTRPASTSATSKRPNPFARSASNTPTSSNKRVSAGAS